MSINIKNVNEREETRDGVRILVDEHMPEGMDEYRLKVDLWPRELAPSEQLCMAYGEHPERWEEFVRAYHRELDAERDIWISAIMVMARKSVVTLLYTCGSPERNIAAVVRDYILGALEEQPEEKAA